MATDAYEELAKGIVLQAFENYKKAFVRILKDKNKDRRMTKKEKYQNDLRIVECERFFNGDWYIKLTDINPDAIMKEAKEQAEVEYKKYKANKLKKK